MLPIIVRIIKGKKIISFFGSYHSSDVKQIELIKKEIKFTKPQIVLVEDQYHLSNYKNEKEAIKEGRESGFASYYAKKKGIEVSSNDPCPRDDIKNILAKFGEELTFLYFVLLIIDQEIRFKKKINKKDIKRAIEIFYDEAEISKSKNENDFFDVFKRELGQSFKFDKDYSDLFDPNKRVCKLNEISRVQDRFRDSFMMNKIKDLLKTYDKIFIIKGDGHLEHFMRRIIKIL
jgi:hypothetical protein